MIQDEHAILPLALTRPVCGPSRYLNRSANFSRVIITHPTGRMVRDARRCRAPHHEGLEDLILRSGHLAASRRMKPPDWKTYSRVRPEAINPLRAETC